MPPRDPRLLAVGTAIMAAFMLFSTVVVLGPWEWGEFLTGETLSVASGLLACVSSVYVVLRTQGALRRAWVLIATMSLMYSVADVLWLVFGAPDRDVPVLVVADSLYLVGVVPAVLGLVLYPMARGLGRTWLPLTLDGLLLGSSALLVIQVLALDEVNRMISGFDTVVYVLFPTTSVLLACLVLLLLVRSVGSFRPDVILLGLGFAAFALGDIGFALLYVRGEAIDGTVFDLAFVWASLLHALAGLAAIRFGTRPRVLQRNLTRPAAQVLPDLAAVAALGLSVTLGADGAWLGLVALVLVLTGLRQMTVISQNLRLRQDLERTISDRTEDLTRITAEHSRLDAMKREFVSAVSHELRTPLTAIRGALEMLRDGDVGELPQHAGPVVDIATRGSQRLSRLVDDIIDLERLESGTFGFHPGPCNVHQLLTEAVDSLTPLAREAGVHVVVSSATAEVDIDCDRVTQALVNLIGNALKFTPPDGIVTIASTLTPDAVRISVTDTGRGIPPDELQTIFAPFHQVEPDEARQNPGTGLGLSITQRIVEAHGGRIWAESTPGRGSAFHFTLPSRGPAGQQAGQSCAPVTGPHGELVDHGVHRVC